MNELRDTLQQIADLIDAAHQRVTVLQITQTPARLAGLNLIGLYLSSARHAIAGALSIARRI